MYQYQRCDGDRECSDGSDEDNCPTTRTCYSSEFRCNNGDCINSYQRCDGDRECSDGSDELNCPTSYCEKHHSLSLQTSLSLSLSLSLCVASCYHFRCDSGQCLSGDYECDGYEDCSDGSDEDDCGTTGRNSSFSPPSLSTTLLPSLPLFLTKQQTFDKAI